MAIIPHAIFPGQMWSRDNTRRCPMDSLPIVLGANTNISSLEQALRAPRPQKSEEKQVLFDLPIPDLGSQVTAATKACAAWGVLIASHASTAGFSVFAPGPGEYTASLDISIQWRSHIGDLTRQVRDRLDEYLPSPDEPSSSSESASSSSGDDRVREDYYQAFLILLDRSQQDSENLLLECRIQPGTISAAAIGKTNPWDKALLPHISRHFEYIIREICSPEDVEKPLVELKAVTVLDLEQIWSWNARVPRGVGDVCIHEAFMERAKRHPELLAVSAHDGNLTYRELDELSTRLANLLIQQCIQPSSTIIVFIEKSMWVPVAQVAIMKSGCVSTVLDASLPFQRQQSIAELVRASAILTSPECEEKATALSMDCPQFILDGISSRHWPGPATNSLPIVSPSAWMYIVFTSGSTGTPKGAIISHANYASAVATQGAGLDFREFDRVFDFASYAFDAAWCNLIHALMIGGCLCIPSDEERKNDLAAALRKYQVNYAVLTPSVAWFPAAELPSSLRTIHFGGEPLKAALVKELSASTTVINAYGPAECSTVSTAIVADPNDGADPTIGTGLGACTWVVKLDGTDLVPIGEIGELWLEGPIVGQGYLRDPEKTSTTFVDNPPWLLRGCPSLAGTIGHTGRSGRLYRTGDLVRYRKDGNLEFVGRKDSQVKIRGQRVELGEIEHNLRRALTDEARDENVQIVAEVIRPDGSDAPTLVCFLFTLVSAGVSSTHNTHTLHRALEGLEDRLVQFAPPYMVPSAFFTIPDVPMTATGKVDRRRLREDGAKLYWQQLNSQPGPEQEEDMSELEVKLRNIWSEVLNVSIDKIGLDSVFTRLGGDSITAMQVVSRCRSLNISVKVVDILKLPTIRLLSHVSRPLREKLKWQGEPQVDEGTSWHLTPIQQIFFNNNPQGINHYTLSYIVKLARDTGYQELLDALTLITTRHSMLRARFRKGAESVWEQYVAPPGPTSFALEQHAFVDRSAMQHVVDKRQAGLDLAKGPVFAVDVFNRPGEMQTLLMSAHHVVMDLVSWRIIWHELSQYLSGSAPPPPPDISFHTWCRLQREEGERLSPEATLPFEVTPAHFEYWAITPEELLFSDSVLDVSIVDAEATALLLGASNNCFRTEILDILVGTLVFSFSQIFTDRHPPPVFLEGHGREPISGMEDDLDLSDVVGWFTSIHPVQIGVGSGNGSILDTIRLAKDVRKKVPGKGRPYFASRFYSTSGKRKFGGHGHAELIFNYRGSFQQLEDAKSMFQLEDREDRNVPIPGDGPDYRRPSIFDMNLVVQEGKLQICTRSHSRVRNHEAVTRWVALYAETLGSVAHELASLPPRSTLADFPLLDSSYAGLDKLTRQLASEGVKETEVMDIYPCTPMQEGILISSNIGAASYNSVSIWQAESSGSAVSVELLAAAWETVMRAHPVFSTVFSTNPDSGRFVQVVLKTPNEVLICQTAASETAVEHLSQMESFRASPSQPQCFVAICAGQDGEVACRLDMTHALMDALSLPVIVRDIEMAYAGKALSLRTPFRSYVEHILATPAHKRLSYWKEYLAGVNTCDIPGDMTLLGSPRSQKNTLYGWITLPATVTEPISRICREKGLTRSAFLHAAWSLVLSYFTGMRQVCFGYISSGRDSPVDGIEDIVGPLINMLIAHVDLEQPLSKVLDTISGYHIDHLENQHVSLAEIQHEMSVKQLFNTNITVRESRGGDAANGGMKLVEILEEDPHEYDLVLSATLNRADIEVNIQYRTDFTTAAYAQDIQAALQTAIGFLCSAANKQNVGAASSPIHDSYFHYAVGCDETTALGQWKTQFEGIDAGCHFPSLPYTPHKSSARVSSSFTIDSLQWRGNYDPTTQIIASWALLQASYGSSSDVVIGFHTSNPVYGASSIDATTTPMRIRVDLSKSVSSYVDSVRSAISTCSELPRVSSHRLCRLTDETAIAWNFQTVISCSTNSETPSAQDHDDESCDDRALVLRFTITASGVQLIANFDSDAISPEQVGRLFSQLETTLRQVCSLSSSSLGLREIDTVSHQDLEAISVWNGTEYESVQDLVHNLIAQTVQKMPDSLAVSSWDGELTYRQLDQLSTRLAHKLVQLGVGPEVIVPLYFEKSMWVPVSAVAVIKAGGAGVVMDSTQPIERACSIVRQVNATLVLTSTDNAARAAQFEGLQLLVVHRASIDGLPNPEIAGLPLPHEVQPSNLVYISFTSGSTGTPKGAMITHSSFASSIKNQQKALGFRPGQRVYDFASYAFDASWSNLLHSLTSGSCLCIPSEHQRRNALSDSIRDSRATLLNVTPSVLRHLDPKEFPHMEQVLMGGEAWAEADFGEWIDRIKLINSYGPGECTIKSCFIRAVRGMVPNTIGFGIGVNTWIIRTDGSDKLAPLGSVGELWLGGPQVARGYIADEAKTAASFVTRPKWALRDNDIDTQPQHFYRTGDLVRYGVDGVLVFVSRKDSQIKIRGQRTELGEVEHNIQKALLANGLRVQVVADVFKPRGSDNPILVSFLKAEGAEAWHKLTGLNERLIKMVPGYMIPTVYITQQEFPMTTTGKVHRKSLREKYEILSLEQLVAQDAFRESGHRSPSTASETLLCSLWAEILKMDPDSISADDSFLRIGGDSLGAMRLVGVARKRNVVLTVADIFKHPRLSDLARIVEEQESDSALDSHQGTIEPFSLMDGKASREETRDHVARLCGLDVTDVEDAFPCTPLQAGLLAETVRRPGDNVLTEKWDIRKDIDIRRFRAAWQRVVQANPILRTRIVDLDQHGLVQAVICYERCGIESGISPLDFSLGTPLVSCRVSDSCFSWSIHHALYDGWSMPLILAALARSYQSERLTDAPPYQGFIRHVTNCGHDEAEEFWRNQFRGFNAQRFPILPSKTYKPRCDKRLKLEISDISSGGDYTEATRIKLAWAILLSTVTNSADASFGTTVSGRQANVPGIDCITGPTFATVPLRVIIDRSKTVGDLLQMVQLQAADMMPFEQLGIQQIRRISEDCDLGCQFQSHMVIQPTNNYGQEESLFEVSPIQAVADDEVDPFKLYAICMEFVLKPNSIYLRATYDSTVVPQSQFRRLASRFEYILRQISSPEAQVKPLYLLDVASRADMEQIWAWNGTHLERSDQTVHGIFQKVAFRQPKAPAICSWDGDFTYGQLDHMSTLIAHQLLRTGLPQTGRRIVPLLFEKSKWTSVVQLAVMKANGTSVALDANLPDGRLHKVIDLVQPQIILASAEQESRARQLAPSTAEVVVVGDHSISSFIVPEDPQLPVVASDTWLYLVFTSGSTGIPKGVIISHSNFTSALKHGQTALQFGPQTRAYDFVSYAFDVSWLNVLYTLCAGGCLCVPSHHEIQNEPKEAIARRHANTAFITPTVGKLLHGADLKVINYGGETLPRDEIHYWKDKAQIIHSYGPSECTPISISHILDPERSRVIIGKGLGARTWIVESEQGKSLAAVGDIGELWLEGPLVGQGYLDDPEKTQSFFIEDPEWLLRGGPGFVGRRGRLYRTGDLVRYEEDGNLEFIGRKDAQIKIRGQRVELEEIEHHVLDAINIGEVSASEAIVDIIKPAGSAEQILVAFIKLSETDAVLPNTPEAQAYAQNISASIRGPLSATIPNYMIPNGYLIVDKIPLMTSGKADRGMLRKNALSIPKEYFLQGDRIQRRAPTTPEERKFHAIIAAVLSRDEESFGMDNNFIQLGGDSISAMRLASAARGKGIFLTVADILTKSRIADLLITDQEDADLKSRSEQSSFALLDMADPRAFVRNEVMPQVSPGRRGTIIDLLPVTDMQRTYLRDNLYSPRRSWFYSYIDFAKLPDIHRLIQSCEKLVEICDIYRTAFVRCRGAFFQAVFDSWAPTIDTIDDVDSVEAAFKAFVKEDISLPAPLGSPFLQFKLIRGRSGKAKLVFGASHAVYDAMSFSQTLKILSDIYHGSSFTPETKDFRVYVNHTQSHKAESYAYWRRTLASSSMTTIPCTSTSVDLETDGPPTVLERSIAFPQPPIGITQASLFTLACASALSRLTRSPDVVFGRVVSGRASVPDSLQNVVGPCLNRLPVRVIFSPGQTKRERLVILQKQYAEGLAHDAVGLSDIAKHCTNDWPRDTRDFGCWTQYQNVDENPLLSLPGAVGGLKSKEMWDIPVAADFLEIFAVPGGEGTLKLRLIAGPGYAAGVTSELLEGVCSELSDTLY